MKIDRDNFRHLTGFGRDMANIVESVPDSIRSDDSMPGNLILIHTWETGSVSYQFKPFERKPEVFARLGVEYIPDLQTTLSICADRNGFREVVSFPIYLLRSECRGWYHIYQHMFVADQNGVQIDGCIYTGVTKRGWRTRWHEHLRSANSGSHCLFHKAIRQWHGIAKTSMHLIVGCTPSEQDAMEFEEKFVERDSFYPLGLNMIPGGYAGLAYLRKIGALGKHERVSVDDVDAIVNRFFERASRKGLPNPLAAANWLNSDYAEKVICAGPDRLKPQQIRDARFFSSLGQNADDIATKIGARNAEQVERLISGQTYSRIV